MLPQAMIAFAYILKEEKYLTFVSAMHLHIIGFEAKHHHWRGIGSPGQTEAIGIFDAQPIDADDLARALEAGVLLQPFDERIVLPLGDTVTGIQVRRERLGISAAWLTGGSSVARRAGGDWVRDCERELEPRPRGSHDKAYVARDGLLACR